MALSACLNGFENVLVFDFSVGVSCFFTSLSWSDGAFTVFLQPAKWEEDATSGSTPRHAALLGSKEVYPSSQENKIPHEEKAL